MAPENVDSGDAWAWAAMEPEMNERDKKLRDMFVDEYLKDNDATAAASRVGFQNAFAEQYGQKFKGEAYVQKRLQMLREQQPEDQKDYEKKVKLSVMRNLEFVMNTKYFSGSSRVSAARALADILGMNAPVKSQQTLTHQGGIMVVPAIADINEWEKQATASQETLVRDARH